MFEAFHLLVCTHDIGAINTHLLGTVADGLQLKTQVDTHVHVCKKKDDM